MSRNEIENILVEVGVPLNIKGFKYIADAMVLCFDGWNEAAITNLYEKIARMNGTSAKAVERGIRTAFSGTRKSGEPEYVIKYFGKYHQNSRCLRHLYWRLKNEKE